MSSNRFIECVRRVQSAAGEGILDDQFATDLLTDLKNKATARVDIDDVPTAVRNAATELIQDIRRQSLEQKIKAYSQIRTAKQVQRNLNDIMARGISADKALEGLLVGNAFFTDSADYRIRASIQRAKAELYNDLKKAKAFKTFASGKKEDLIVKEMQRIDNPSIKPTGDAEAYKVATIWYNHRKKLLSRLERHGIFIEQLEGYVVHQTTDANTLRRLAKRSLKQKKKDGVDITDRTLEKESFDIWYSDIAPRLDYSKMGLDQENAKSVLKQTHRNIFNGVHGDLKDLTASNAYSSYRKKLGISRIEQMHRVLHFKNDGESWFGYNQRFGRNSVRDQYMLDVENLTRLSTLVETFGPDYEAGMKRARSVVEKLSREDQTRDTQSELRALSHSKFNWYMEEIQGRLDNPTSVNKATAWRTWRANNTMASLGQVLLSALPDKFLFNAEARYLGIERADIFIKQLTFLSKQGDLESIRKLGAGVEAYLGYMSNRVTESISTGTQGRVHTAMEAYMKLTGLAQWDRGHRRAFATMLASHLGNNASKRFDDINPNLKRAMEDHGFTSQDWEALRKFSIWTSNDEENVIGGITYMTSDALDEADIAQFAAIYGIKKGKSTAKKKGRNPVENWNAALRKRDELKLKLDSFYEARGNHAVITPTGRERALMSLGTKSGETFGEIVRSFMQFKSFPLTVMTKALAREHAKYGATKVMSLSMEANKGKLAIIALAAQMTIAGMMVNAIKDILKGRTPRPLVLDGKLNMDVIMQGIVRGGGLPIIGDLFLNDYDKRFRNPASVFMGPSLSKLSEAFVMATDALQGEEFDKNSAYKMVKSTIPGLNLLYVKPVIDHLFLHSLDEAFSEGSIKRTGRAIQEQGQEYLNTGTPLDLLNPENRQGQ